MASLASSKIPASYFWDRYELNPFTGQFWSKRQHKYVNGTQHKERRITYIQLIWDGKRTTTNYGRAVFAFMHGRWPDPTVDHINRDWTDNRPWNLREATHREQANNRSTSLHLRE